jgi:hypothetical protein
MYNLMFVTRARSSGYENRHTIGFETIEAASNYIRNQWYDSYFEEEEWDEEHMKGPQPTKDEFSPEAIVKKLGNQNTVALFDPYNYYHALVPDEIIISKVKVFT